MNLFYRRIDRLRRRCRPSNSWRGYWYKGSIAFSSTICYSSSFTSTEENEALLSLAPFLLTCASQRSPELYVWYITWASTKGITYIQKQLTFKVRAGQAKLPRANPQVPPRWFAVLEDFSKHCLSTALETLEKERKCILVEGVYVMSTASTQTALPCYVSLFFSFCLPLETPAQSHNLLYIRRSF